MTDPGPMVFFDGAILTPVYEKEAFVRVFRSDDLDTGQVLWSVDRSIQLAEDRPLYQPVLELLGDAQLLGSETIDDVTMMGGAMIRSIYMAAPSSSPSEEKRP